MQVMQRVARKYGLVCSLHEKLFAGVNGWASTTTGRWAPTPGREPARSRRHAAREHQLPVLLRGRDPGGHQQAPGPASRLGRAGIGQTTASARTRRPAIISIFLGAELTKVFEAMASGEGDPQYPGSFLELGAEVLPPLPMHGGDRNRRLAVRPLSQATVRVPHRLVEPVARLPQHGAEHDRRRGDRRASDKLESRSTGDLATAVTEVVKESYIANKQIVFDGDNYDEAWHKEAEERGLKNLRNTWRRCPRSSPSPRSSVPGTTGCSTSASSSLATRSGLLHHPRQHRGRDRGLDRADDDPAGRPPLPALGDDADRGGHRRGDSAVDELVAAIKELDSANQHRGDRGDGPRDPRPGQADRRDVPGPRGGGQAGENVPDDLWPLLYTRRCSSSASRRIPIRGTELEPGQVLLGVDRFGLTTNDIT